MGRRTIILGRHFLTWYRLPRLIDHKRHLLRTLPVGATRPFWADRPLSRNTAAAAQILCLPIGVAAVFAAMYSAMYSVPPTSGMPGNSGDGGLSAADSEWLRAVEEGPPERDMADLPILEVGTQYGAGPLE